jgi:hypothetical protein
VSNGECRNLGDPIGSARKAKQENLPLATVNTHPAFRRYGGTTEEGGSRKAAGESDQLIVEE